MKNFINKIGLEFEGLYSDNFIDDLKFNKNINDITTDGSLSSWDDNGTGSDQLETFEARTRPLTLAKTKKILDLFKLATINGEYMLNDTCGLHYHISLKKQAYAAICNPQFYHDYIRLFKNIAPDVYSIRKNNSYCKARLPTPTYHFQLSSDDRYHIINYCYYKHGTVEFRGYGGSEANFEELYQLIISTIKLINQYSNKLQIIDQSKIDIDKIENRSINYQLETPTPLVLNDTYYHIPDQQFNYNISQEGVPNV